MAAVVVLGAGAAGLQAGLDLCRAGHDVTVLEAGDRVGGMAASIEVSGQRVDLGSHRLHPATPPEFLDAIQQLLGTDLQERERNGRLHIDGRWIGFPLRAGDLARNAPPAFSARVVADTLAAPLRRTTPRSFGDAIRSRLGPTVAASFYDPYARKLYGTPANALSVELADRRVSASSTVDIVRRVVRARKTSGRSFLYPRRGYGQIVEALASAAVAAGADIRLATRADALDLAGDHAVVQTDHATVHADAVLTSIPPSALAALLPSVPHEVQDALSTVRTRAMVLLYLTLPTDRYTDYDAHYIPQTDCVTARLSEPKNYRDGDDPPGQTVLCAEIPCWEGDELWRADDDRLAAMVLADLGRLGLPPASPVAIHTVRLPSVYPVYESASEAARALIDRWSTQLTNVLVFGRQGLAAPDNLHHVLAMGRAAAAAVDRTGAIDRDAWQRSLEAFARHVVED